MYSYELVPTPSYGLMTELYGPYNLEQELLAEGFDKSTVKGIIQFVISGAAEYGLGTITLPAAGAGLAVGPVCETLVDSFFALDSIRGALQIYDNAQQMLEDYKALWDNCINSYDPKNLKGYYDAMVALIQKAVGDFFDAAGEGTAEAVTEKIEEYVEKFKDSISKMISKMLEPVKAGIKLIIPDATIGLAAAEGLGALLQSLAENAYDSLESVIGKFETLSTFITDPEACISFFEDLFKQLGDMLTKMIAELRGEGDGEAKDADGDGLSNAAEKTLGASPFESTQRNNKMLNEMMMIPGLPDAMTAPLKIKGIEFVIDKLNDAGKIFLELLEGVLKKVIPMMITGLGIYQILMKGDWKPPEEPEEEAPGEEKEESPEKKEESFERGKLLEINLRRIIRDELYNQYSQDKIKLLGSN